jgi:conjugative relaxase-like TrwC/TraI family protein
MRVMHAGDGYRYLLATVAAGDGDRDLSSPLTRYYTEAGSPPGRWRGTGLGDIGLADGQQVTEQHLELLLGHGLHPLTAAPLGRAYPKYPAAAERIAARIAALGPAMPPGQVAEVTQRIEAEERAKPMRHACAGYDLTFSPPKSVSVLWGLADAGTQQLLMRAHHDAVAQVIDLFEREVAATRTGATKPATRTDAGGAVLQADVAGIAAAWFDHYDSRAGDPQAHTHIVVSAKVKTAADGAWRALDGRPVHQSLVALSAHYNAVLADILARDFGLAWEARERGRDRNPALELAAVPPELVTEFASRASDIDTESERLVADYQAKHGRQPSKRAILALRQQATLTTRPAKRVRSLAELTAEWRDRSAPLLQADPAAWVSSVLGSGARQPLLRADDVPLAVIEQVGQQVMATVGDRRATWRRWNLFAEAARQTMGWRFASARDRETVTAMIADAAQQASMLLTPGEPLTLAALQRGDGSSRLRPKHSALYTSEALYAAEERLLALSRQTGAPEVSLSAIRAAAAQATRDGSVLGEDQTEALERIAVSGLTVDLLVGPAGAGKTTAMRVLRHAWEREHGIGSVMGLAPSATAAAVLGEDLGIATENTAKWLADHDRGLAAFRPRQPVILDEASLCGTFTLDRITTLVAEAGAKVLLVGDWAQLQAVEAGGAFHLLVQDRGDPPRLADVHRFHNDWEKTASLALRFGHLEVIDAYADHGRVVVGDADYVRQAAYTGWKLDTEAGLASILVADDNRTVADLNRQARHDRILGGLVDATCEASLTDGARASAGDAVITRRNDRRLTGGKTGWVRNGDRWTVLRVMGDGSVTVRRAGHQRGGTVTLPAAYVAEHVDLGYAITAQRAQGVTVDTSHVVTTEASTRETFYVAMTRGRQANTCYVATDQPVAETDALRSGEPRDAKQVLAEILLRRFSEQSAHQAEQAEHDQWESIAQLVAEYETIRRANPLSDQQRLAQATGMASVPNRRYVLGLIPAVPPGHVPPEFQAALTDCERRMLARANELVQRAIRDNEPWLRVIRTRQRAGDQARTSWQQTVRTVAAYRDMYGITTAEPLGTKPADPAQRIHHQRAQHAPGTCASPCISTQRSGQGINLRPPALGL